MRLIDTDAAIDAIAELTSSMSVCISVDECHGMKRMQGMAVRALEGLPAAQPEPKTGHWIEHENADIVDGYYVPKYECSCCHTWKHDDSDYCPDCGMKMCGTTTEGDEHEID